MTVVEMCCCGHFADEHAGLWPADESCQVWRCACTRFQWDGVARDDEGEELDDCSGVSS